MVTMIINKPDLIAPQNPTEYLAYKIGKLNFLHDEYSEELLQNIIGSTYRDPIYENRFKVRIGRFSAIGFEIETLYAK